ncbi:MAG TPA: replicative DNA helicase [Candidatus Binatia bacterium]|nr:replicative DNA helicase [Candidatus Binatia bacterium]
MDLQKHRRRRPAADAVNTARLPPHAEDMERAVLGCMLVAAVDSIPKCVERLRDGVDAFYDLRHQTIYRNMVAMHDKQQPVDILSVMQRLKDCELLDQVGGIVYLNGLQDAFTSAANLDWYLDAIREKGIRRKMISICTEVVGRAYEEGGAIEELMDEMERDVLGIRKFQTVSKAIDTPELVDRTIRKIEMYYERQGQLIGITTGFIDLDKMTGGLTGGEMVLIAARPSMGKTSLAMNMAEKAAVDLQLPVGVFSLEMSAESLMMRMICSRARVNMRNITDGFISERDFAPITSSSAAIRRAPLYIDDSSALSIMELRARARRMFQEHGIKLLVVDYLQLLQATIGKKRVENRQQEISEISAGLKALAKELDIPVIVLSQLSRDLEKQKRKPILADLRESGSLEQDGDKIILLYRPERGDDDDVDRDACPVNAIVAKQRNGPTGEVYLTFIKTLTRFENAAKVTDYDMPNDNQGSLPV